jgi:hypothetical protein
MPPSFRYGKLPIEGTRSSPRKTNAIRGNGFSKIGVDMLDDTLRDRPLHNLNIVLNFFYGELSWELSCIR